MQFVGNTTRRVRRTQRTQRSRRNNQAQPARGRQRSNLMAEVERREREIERLQELFRMSQDNTSEARYQIRQDIEEERRKQDIALRQIAAMDAAGLFTLSAPLNAEIQHYAREGSFAEYPERVPPRHLQNAPMNTRSRRNNMNQVRRRLF